MTESVLFSLVKIDKEIQKLIIETFKLKKEESTPVSEKEKFELEKEYLRLKIKQINLNINTCKSET